MAHSAEEPDPGERAALWLERSRLDYEGLQRLMTPLSDPPLAVYLLQQCVEKAVKALLVARGEDEAKIKETFGHKSLKAYLDHFRKLVDKLEPQIDIIQNITGSDFRKPRKDLLTLKPTRYRSEWAAASLERVRSVLEYLTELRRSINRGVESILGQVLTVKGLDPKLCSVFAQMYDPEFANEAQRRALSASGRAEMQEEVTRRFDFVWALIALGYLAAFTHPHHSAPRYPSSPDAPEDPFQAANRDKLGFDLYRSPLGIAEGLEDVVKLTGTVIEALDPIPPAPSENDLNQVGELLDRVGPMLSTRPYRRRKRP